jgi:hypothetical protein
MLVPGNLRAAQSRNNRATLADVSSQKWLITAALLDHIKNAELSQNSTREFGIRCLSQNKPCRLSGVITAR